MSQHRIFGSEADQPKPLAYVRTFRPSRRRFRGYVTAAVIGGFLTLAAGAAMVIMSSAGVGPAMHPTVH